MKKLADVKTSDDCISLTKLLGKKIVDLHGYVSREFGDSMFAVSCVVFEDGSEIYFGGEHDTAFLDDYDVIDDQLDALYIEENGEEEDE